MTQINAEWKIQTYLKGLTPTQRHALYPIYSDDMFEDMFDELTEEYQKQEYNELKQDFIRRKADFALETPFADNFGLTEVLFFKQERYVIQGIFFGLDTVEQSIANVSLRVQKAGHDLPLQSIRWNFKQCYANLKKHLPLFDSILFIDAQNPLIEPLPVALYANQHFHSLRPKQEKWLLRIF